MTDQERFDSFVYKGADTGCWLWTGGKSSTGYGVFYLKGKALGAHRYALTRAKKPTNRAAWALHRCDVKSCVNPDHLYWGDHRANTIDAISRKRTACGKRHGTHTHPESRTKFERNAFSKISREAALEITSAMADGVCVFDLAKKYKIHFSTVYRARDRILKGW